MTDSTLLSDRLSSFAAPTSGSTWERTTSSRSPAITVGRTVSAGAGAGGLATAVAVVSDLLSLTQRERDRGEEWLPAPVVPPPARPYYLRFVVQDRPGILASIAASLAHQGINLDAVLQEPGYPKDALPFVITIEPCEEGALATAVQEIAAADFHAEGPLALPMLLGQGPQT